MRVVWSTMMVVGIWELKIKRQENPQVMCNNAFSSFTAGILSSSGAQLNLRVLITSKDHTRKSRLLADTISAVYLDGYEGRQ